MKIINYDAPVNLAKKVKELRIPQYILAVLRPLEEIYYCQFACYSLRFPIIETPQPTLSSSKPLPIRKFATEGYENIATLVHTIPIYLRVSKPQEVRDEDSIIDLLGAYYSNRHGDTPYIELYLQGIDDATKDNDEHFKWLFVKVLIHELAHAALDVFNWEHHDGSAEKISYQTKFGRWREESMVNAVTLRIIKLSGKKKLYKYAKDFMQSQPPEYALGVKFENFRDRDFRIVFDEKIRGIDQQLQDDWLSCANNNPTEKDLLDKNDKLDNDMLSKFVGYTPRTRNS